MNIGGFEVEQELWRTPGSYYQETYPYKPEVYEESRKYYIVKNSQGERLFIKEYANRGYGGAPLGFPANIEHEYSEAKKYVKTYVYVPSNSEKSYNIRSVEAIDLDDNMILFDLIPEEFAKPFSFSNETWYDDFHEELNEALQHWAVTHKIRAYDMCDNNTFIRLMGNQVDVILIDFEYSQDRSPMIETYPLRRNR